MASKSTRLMQDALARAAAEPSGLPLFSAKSAPGLFPATAVARQAAQRCQDEGFLSISGDGKRELGMITDQGLQWLLTQASPRQVLEDFVRVLEERRGQVSQLIAAAQNLATGLDALSSAVERLRPQMLNGHAAIHKPKFETAIVAELNAWHAAEHGDCPLPALYRKIGVVSDLTIGRFHDALRELHDEHQVWLHPWTGPLYQLPEPPFALLVGHEIAYYASLREETRQ